MLDRHIYVCLFSFVFAMPLSTAQAESPDRPNILWLSTEDIGPQLGCYGYDINTPELDKLAKNGLTYDMAWSTYPVCAPARTTIITGMYATALGAGNMRCAAIKPEGLELLPELMRKAGYYCTNASKTDYNLLKVDNVWDESSGKAHWKNRPAGKPFFAVFNHTGTHESKTRKRPHEKQIDPESVKLFPYWPDTPEVRQDWAQYLDNIQTMDKWVARHLSQLKDAGLAEDTIVFFWGDHGAGMPRHKRYAGDSGMRVPLIVHVPEKWKAYYSSNYAAGARSDWPVGFIDFAPTVLKIAGAQIPERMQGKSFLGAKAKKAKYVFGIRNRMDERVDVSRSVCDGRYVYIRNFMPHLPHGQFVEYQQTTDTTRIWYEKFRNGLLKEMQSAFWEPRAKEQLFDLQNDPHETNNLANDDSFQKKLQELRNAVRKQSIKIGDLDLVPESMLYEFEQETGNTRVNYSKVRSFSFEDLFDAADGTDALDRIHSEIPELRYWALANLISSEKELSTETIDTIQQCVKFDPSVAVRLMAAECLFSKRIRSEEHWEMLLQCASGAGVNYYDACVASDILDRYAGPLGFPIERSREVFKKIKTKYPEIKRGNDNMEKLKRRFVAEPDSSSKKSRVLILGDSISIGYTPFVQKMLSDEATVLRPMRNENAPENCAGTDIGVKNIDRWLKIDGGNWDVIHVNFGLHDLKHVDAETGKNSNDPADPLQSNPKEYERQLREIMAKVKVSGAKVIVCTTTPVPPGCKPLREITSPTIYNEIAKQVAAENNFEVNDLFSFANSRLAEIQKPKNVHFTNAGSKQLAKKVADSIRKQLSKVKK
jgi:uncharacterized sulfatase